MPGKPLIYQDDTIVASPAAAAETVVCKLKGVASRFGGAVKLSGWVNVTPDTDATAIVLRVRRGTTTGGTLVTPAETVGFGASAGGGAVLGEQGDSATADAATAIPFAGGPTTVPCIIAAPPAWMDNAGNIIEEGMYAVALSLAEVGPVATPGQYLHAAGWFSDGFIVPIDALATFGGLFVSDWQSLGAADLPYPASFLVIAPTDATASATGQIIVSREAFTAGAGGGLITPGDAVLDVIDLPGQIAQASYVLTAQMTGANSPSVINGVKLTARID